MSSQHLTKEMVRRFLLEELTLGDRRDLVRHLLTRCPACHAVADEVAREHGYRIVEGEFEREEGAPDLYHETFLQVLGGGSELERRLARERLRGAGQWAGLAKYSEARRLLEARNDPRLRHWGFLQTCLDHAKAVGQEDPTEAVDAAYLAVAVAEQLEPAEYGRERVADFRASALAALGNAKRQAEDFEGAAEAFRSAHLALEEGSGEAGDRAELASLEASLHYDLGEFEAAIVTLETAAEVYREADDKHMVGRTFVKQANALGHLEPEKAVAAPGRPGVDRYTEGASSGALCPP